MHARTLAVVALSQTAGSAMRSPSGSRPVTSSTATGGRPPFSLKSLRLPESRPSSAISASRAFSAMRSSLLRLKALVISRLPALVPGRAQEIHDLLLGGQAAFGAAHLFTPAAVIALLHEASVLVSRRAQGPEHDRRLAQERHAGIRAMVRRKRLRTAVWSECRSANKNTARRTIIARPRLRLPPSLCGRGEPPGYLWPLRAAESLRKLMDGAGQRDLHKRHPSAGRARKHIAEAPATRA